MFLFGNFFAEKTTISRQEREKIKITNDTLHSYYSHKIKYLSLKELDPVLLGLTCSDAPYPFKKSFSKQEKKSFAQKCLQFYKEKLMECEKNLKSLKKF